MCFGRGGFLLSSLSSVGLWFITSCTLFFSSSFVLLSVDTDCHFYVFKKVVRCVLNCDFVFDCVLEPLVERVYLGVLSAVESVCGILCHDAREVRHNADRVSWDIQYCRLLEVTERRLCWTVGGFEDMDIECKILGLGILGSQSVLDVVGM